MEKEVFSTSSALYMRLGVQTSTILWQAKVASIDNEESCRVAPCAKFMQELDTIPRPILGRKRCVVNQTLQANLGQEVWNVLTDNDL